MARFLRMAPIKLLAGSEYQITGYQLIIRPAAGTCTSGITGVTIDTQVLAKPATISEKVTKGCDYQVVLLLGALTIDAQGVKRLTPVYPTLATPQIPTLSEKLS